MLSLHVFYKRQCIPWKFLPLYLYSYSDIFLTLDISVSIIVSVREKAQLFRSPHKRLAMKLNILLLSNELDSILLDKVIQLAKISLSIMNIHWRAIF